MLIPLLLAAVALAPYECPAAAPASSLVSTDDPARPPVDPKDETAKGKKAEDAKGKKAGDEKGKKAEDAKGKKAEDAKGKKAEDAKGKKAEDAKGKKAEDAKGKKAGDAKDKKGGDAKGKKAGDGKDAKGDKAPEARPRPVEWEHAGSPISDFLFLSRELPDFTGLPDDAQKLTLAVVALRAKALLFLEGCQADRGKRAWTVSGCRAVKVEEGTFLSKLVAGGTDTEPDPDSARKLAALFADARKARDPAGLVPLLLPSAVSERKGVKANDDLVQDHKACGDAKYRAALGSLPLPAYVGSNAVVLDIAYVVERGGSSFKVQASVARTRKDGWRFGSLRVRCY